MFKNLYDYTLSTLCAQLDAKPLKVDPRFARREGVLRGNPLVMTNVAFETKHLRKVRVTYMDAGDAAQILTTMAFPRFETDMPIFGADVLGFRGKPHLIVIDHQPLYKTDQAYNEYYLDRMATMYEKYAHLPARNRTLPDWTEEFFSPYTHYSRPEIEHLEEVHEAYRAYWASYLTIAKAPRLFTQEIDHNRIQNRQAAYCRNHVENEQAEGMLEKLFGVDYCHDFINDFLFDVHPISQATEEQFA